jgi:pheromone shutdown protein TraB
MTNNVPYAVVWEERDAMIAKNMLRIERNIRRFK